MKIYSEKSISNFQFWSGAKEDAEKLTDAQFDELESIFEDLYPEGIDETTLNDLFRFEFDWIKGLLGIEDEDTEDDENE